jgi:hypothetical protein
MITTNYVKLHFMSELGSVRFFPLQKNSFLVVLWFELGLHTPKLLFYSLSILCYLEGNQYVQPTLKGWGVMLQHFEGTTVLLWETCLFCPIYLVSYLYDYRVQVILYTGFKSLDY